jgi:hypothetical protein
VVAEVEAEPQKKIYDEWGNFVARADLWVVEPVGCTSTTARRTATENDTAQTSGATGLVEIDWQRIGFTSPQLLYEAASIIAGLDRLLGRAWDPRRLARPCSTSRFSGLAVAPEQSVAGDGLSKQMGKCWQIAGLTQAEPRFTSTFVGHAARPWPSHDVEGDRRAFRCWGTRSGVGVDNEVDARAVDANPLHLGLEAGLAHHLPSRR